VEALVDNAFLELLIKTLAKMDESGISMCVCMCVCVCV